MSESACSREGVDKPLSNKELDKLLAALGASLANRLGLAGIVVGIVFFVLGSVLEGIYGPAIRSLGGVILLAGLGILLFGEPRRRAAVIASARRVVDDYKNRTAHWRWPDRMGLAGVAIGLLLLVPAVFMGILFGAIGGTLVMWPALVFFWGGAVLLIYGRFYRRSATPKGPRGKGGARR